MTDTTRSLIEALKFYAEEKNYDMLEHMGVILDSCPIEYDRGKAAREAIAAMGDASCPERVRSADSGRTASPTTDNKDGEPDGYLCREHERASSVPGAECSECYRERIDQGSGYPSEQKCYECGGSGVVEWPDHFCGKCCGQGKLLAAPPIVHTFHINPEGGKNVVAEGNDLFCHAHEVASYMAFIKPRLPSLELNASGHSGERGAENGTVAQETGVGRTKDHREDCPWKCKTGDAECLCVKRGEILDNKALVRIAGKAYMQSGEDKGYYSAKAMSAAISALRPYLRTAEPVVIDEKIVTRLVMALMRVTDRFRLAVQQKPVRDMDETLAEVEGAIKAAAKAAGVAYVD